MTPLFQNFQQEMSVIFPTFRHDFSRLWSRQKERNAGRRPTHHRMPRPRAGLSFCNGRILQGFFAGSSTSVGLTLGGKLAEVFTAALGGHRPAFAAHNLSRWELILLEKIIGKRDGSAKQFPTEGSIGK
jgi:hypothetical protein